MIGAASAKSEEMAQMVAVCNTCSNNPDRVAGSLDIEDLDKLQLLARDNPTEASTQCHLERDRSAIIAVIKFALAHSRLGTQLYGGWVSGAGQPGTSSCSLVH